MNIRINLPFFCISMAPGATTRKQPHRILSWEAQGWFVKKLSTFLPLQIPAYPFQSNPAPRRNRNPGLRKVIFQRNNLNPDAGLRSFHDFYGYILSSTPLAHISWVWTGKEEKQFPGSKFKKVLVKYNQFASNIIDLPLGQEYVIVWVYFFFDVKLSTTFPLALVKWMLYPWTHFYSLGEFHIWHFKK